MNYLKQIYENQQQNIQNQLKLINQMSKKHKNNEKSQIPKKNFSFFLGSKQRYIRISSDFDSGNIDVVRQLSQFSYRLESIHDGVRTGNKVNSKSWFHFCVQGFPKNTKGKFIVNKVQTLASVFYSKYNKSYRPVYRIQGQNWKRIQTQTQLVLRQTGQIQCVFQYLFKSEQEKVYFAFCYPYSYEKNLAYIKGLNQYCCIDDFYFYKEVLAKSPEDRDIHLLTITSYDHQDKQHQNQQIFNQLLFPQKKRPLKFNKPVVLLTARVHPGETPASFTMQGIINFLTNKQDLRANLLRKMFVFMIVPMINVDGVYYGHFRMDIYGKNLNRFYIEPNFKQQPAIYAIKQLANHLCKENRLSFYFDLHAHNAKKGCFIYGNAINDFVQQVQSQVFCKLFAMNHKGFQYNYCNFSQKHMNAKDTNEDMTKQGCGRVVMYRLANIIHSYSLQCGIISANKSNMIPDPVNTQFQINGKRLTTDYLQNNKDPVYNTKSQQGPLFTEDMYRNLGKNLLVSILDVFDKNPYSRVYNSHYKSMDMLRRITAFQIFHNTQRFRMFQRFVYGKVKNINQLIKQVLNQKLHYKQLYNFYFFDDKSLKDIIWPDNIPGLSKPIPKSSSPSKLRKFRSLGEPRKQYQFQFLQILQKNKLNNFQTETINVNSNTTQLKQSNKSYRQQDFSSNSSQTQDLSPCKKNPSQFNQQQFLDYQMQSNQENFISQTDRNFSNALLAKQKKQIHFNSLKLQQVNIQQRGNSPQKYESTESPSVRVRRLLKQENTHIFTSKQSRKSAIVDNRLIDFNVFSKDSLIQSIKQDIKIQLKKQQERKLTELRSKNTYLSHMGHFAQKIASKEKDRIRSTSVKYQDSRPSGSRIQLPALGAHFFVISTSNKAINRKF